ncbi:MAG TPA: DUF5050 domain-containing protein [Calditrichaeota bacterium]|nr:DUF5050 domain-containing protein [Calditrichota bacterium]
MRRFFSILLSTALLIAVFSCSGSKKSSEESAVVFADQQVQQRVEDLKDKIDDNPNSVIYRKQLATVYYENGEKLEAMRTLEKAMAIDPSDAEMKYMYGEIALNMGDKLKAYRSFKDVLQLPSGSIYLDRIAPMFVDAFVITKVVGGSANEAFGNFSSDGNKIIYQTDQNGNWDIYEYDLTTQTSKPLLVTPAHEENPDWAPDGSAFVYSSTRDDHRDVDYNQKLRDIFVYQFANDKEWNLTTNGSNDWRPRYSPDGEYIVFVSERNDLRDVPFYELFGNIFIMEKDGRFQVDLTKTEANNGSPCVAPGSTEEKGTIYFDSDRTGDFEIYKTDLKGSEVTQITFNPNANDVGPDISDRGDKIVFFSDRDGNYEIYLMNTDGSAQQRLTSNPADDLNPVFSPDGNKILFHSNREGNYDLYILDLSQQASSSGISEVISSIDRAIIQLQE